MHPVDDLVLAHTGSQITLPRSETIGGRILASLATACPPPDPKALALRIVLLSSGVPRISLR